MTQTSMLLQTAARDKKQQRLILSGCPMKSVYLIPVVLSSLLLAAHWLRSGQSVLVLIALVAPLVLLIPRRWALRVVQIELALGALEWIRTAVVMVLAREAQGLPWARLAVILTAVILLTVSSAFVLDARPLKKRHPSPARGKRRTPERDDSRTGRTNRRGDKPQCVHT